jgi:hypothetical protein
MTMLEGGCSCGRVRYRLEARPFIVHCCHCRLCQRQTGSAFVLNACLEEEHVRLLGEAPAPVEVPTESGRGHAIFRCPACAIAVWSEYGGVKTVKFVRVGTLDDPTALQPDVHIFVRSKLPWVQLPPGAKAYDEFYDRNADMPEGALERWRAARAKQG